MNQEPRNGSGLGCLMAILVVMLLSGTWVGRLFFGALTVGSTIIFIVMLVAFLSIVAALRSSARRNAQRRDDYNQTYENTYGRSSQNSGSGYGGGSGSGYNNEPDDIFPGEVEHDEENAIDVDDVEVIKDNDNV